MFGRKRKRIRVDTAILGALVDGRWHDVVDIVERSGVEPREFYYAVGRLVEDKAVERRFYKHAEHPRQTQFRLRGLHS